MDRFGDVVHISLCNPAAFDEVHDFGHVKKDEPRVESAARNQTGISLAENRLGADTEAGGEGTGFDESDLRRRDAGRGY